MELIDSYAATATVLQLIAAAVLLALLLSRELYRSRSLAPLWRSRSTLSLLLFVLLLSLCAFSGWQGEGRPILSGGIVAPGSLLTRLTILPAIPWLRRLCEPAIWFLLLALSVAAADAPSHAARFYRSSALLVTGALLLEVLCLLPGGPALRLSADVLFLLLHLALVQLGLACMVIGAFLQLWSRAEVSSPWSLFAGLRVPFAVAAALLISGGALSAVYAPSRPLVGAHYYSWFPENWVGGYAGRKLSPPIVPELGLYRSGDPAVFSRHVEWAESAGIDFFVFDWWPKRREIGKRLREHLSRPGAMKSLQFAMMYESLDLKERREEVPPGESPNLVYLTRPRIERLKKHWEHLAKYYMQHPSYLRIEGRPVLFIYISRHLVGPVQQAVREARAHVRATTGENLYLVGDEVFFNVIGYSGKKGYHMLPEFMPVWERASAFDALTVYNPYDGAKGEPPLQAAPFLEKVEELYQRYTGIAAGLGIPFFPTVLPGYNDRGVRPAEDHPVLARELSDGGSFFAAAIRQIGVPFVDRHTPVLMITSWNEWNEGTQIEPTQPSPPTSLAAAPEGPDFTQGIAHQGYGGRYLDELRQALPLAGSDIR